MQGAFAKEDGKRSTRALLFALILGCHGLLILLTLRGMMRVPGSTEERMVLMSLASRQPDVRPRRPPAPSRHVAAAASSPLVKPLKSPRPSEVLPPASSPLKIDWSAEALIAAQHQTDQLAAVGPRSLDEHQGRAPRAGLQSGGPYQFEWDYAATHRIEVSQGVAIIHLSDRCAVAFLLILPTFACGFGAKIPASGELFKHLHDSP